MSYLGCHVKWLSLNFHALSDWGYMDRPYVFWDLVLRLHVNQPSFGVLKTNASVKPTKHNIIHGAYFFIIFMLVDLEVLS
jgi:hypothetical protein